ncbi:MAG: hypothetical protein M1816_002865 [Peltula sp. TS41687]|nr:MAG: hypothetical protein M1816_002865 [Peltula sp. TS41687]
MEGSKENHDRPIDFVTLGMFIIDEIHFRPPKPPVENIIGGAGSYAALGARLFSLPPSSRTVGWIVDAGSDFPSEIRETIRQWDTSCLLRESSQRLTTRAWNGYGEGEKRAFKYLTPKLRLSHQDLTPHLARSKSFHLICSPTRCIDLVTGIRSLRRKLKAEEDEIDQEPLLIWEPVPDLCVPEELENCYEALKYVDVVGPNHNELAAFFGQQGMEQGSEEVNRGLVEQLSREWLGRGFQGAVVVRAGKAGCYSATLRSSKWIPAYYDAGSDDVTAHSKVVDPTGGGNAFLGGLAIGLVRGGEQPSLNNLEEALLWASVAASFAIEQVGMPSLTHEGKRERWNGADVYERLDEFTHRLRQTE